MIKDLNPKSIIVEPGTRKPQTVDTWKFLKDREDDRRKEMEKRN